MTDHASFEDIELEKAALLGELQGWPAELLRCKPGPDEWSATEVADHLVKTEVEILAFARRGLEKPRRIGLVDRGRTQFLLTVFRSERRVKVPSSASLVLPSADVVFPDVIRRWDQSRVELKQTIESRPAEELSKGIFRHPVGGWMGMPEILDFFSVHIAHHRFQFERLREAG